MNKLFKKPVLTLLLISGLSFSNVYAQTGAGSLKVVGTMLEAFGKGDMTGLKNTVSDDTVWVYEGSKQIPYSGTYNGKDGVVQFISNISSNVEILEFKVNKIVADNNTVVVLGYEKQKIKKNNKILEQKWVQVYTVENGLIVRMEEYANTDNAARLFSK
ncbi:nuclear transport factor 2 family protein [Chryseobacterium sp. M5A1_1a]